MIWATNEVVSVLVFLLPGLVASAIFYSLTSHPKPNEFGQVAQALIFTIVSQAATWVIGLIWPEMTKREDWQLFFPVPVAVAIALATVICTNTTRFTVYCVSSALLAKHRTLRNGIPLSPNTVVVTLSCISTTGADCTVGRKSCRATRVEAIL